MGKCLTPSQKVLILGCGGFIGSHLVERFLREPNLHVSGVDVSDRKIAPLLKEPAFTFHRLDIREAAAVRPLIEESDTVISLVGLCNPSLYNTIPVEVIEANYERPAAIVKACAELDKRLIQFSTCEVYGKTLAGLGAAGPGAGDPVQHEETTQMLLGPVSAQRWSYACAKQLLERLVVACGHEKKLRFSIVRPYNFIGTRMDYLPGIEADGTPRVLACFMAALLKGEPLKLVDGGKSRRCFTYIGDAVEAITGIIRHERECNGRIFNVGNPANETTIAGLAGMMIAMYKKINPGAAAKRIGTENVSSTEFYGEGYEDSDRRVPDISAVSEATGWTPATDLEKTLELTLRYYTDNY